MINKGLFEVKGWGTGGGMRYSLAAMMLRGGEERESGREVRLTFIPSELCGLIHAKGPSGQGANATCTNTHGNSSSRYRISSQHKLTSAHLLYRPCNLSVGVVTRHRADTAH